MYFRQTNYGDPEIVCYHTCSHQRHSGIQMIAKIKLKDQPNRNIV